MYIYWFVNRTTIKDQNKQRGNRCLTTRVIRFRAVLNLVDAGDVLKNLITARGRL